MVILNQNEAQFISKARFIFNCVFKELSLYTNAKVFLAGGALSSLCTGRDVNDFDIFSDFPEQVCQYLKNMSEQNSSSFTSLYENDFVCNVSYSGKKIQVIKKHAFGNPQEIIDHFDFTVCSAVYDGQHLYAHDRFFLDNAQRRLVINNLPHPLSTFKRTYKYVSYGYAMCPVGMNTLIKAITQLEIDFNNPTSNDLMFYPDGRLRFTGVD